VRRTVRSRLLVLAAASFVLVGFGGLPASAAAVADFTQSGLSGASANGQTFSGPSYEMKIGNAFTAGVSGSLQRIDLAVTSYTVYSAPALDAQAQLWNVDGSGSITGAAIASQSIPAASLAPLASGGTFSVVFGTPAAVAAGAKYAFTIGFTRVSGTPSSEIVFSAGVAPAGKRVVAIENGNFILDPRNGMNLTTYVDASPAALPAPPAPGVPCLATTGFDAQPYLLLAEGLLGLAAIAFGISIVLRRRKA
jgi:hypothetical protein